MAGKGPPDITGMTSLKVDCAGSSLPDRWTAEDLKEIFEKYGSVGDVFIPRERFSAKSRAYAFVRFHSESEAAEAMEKMNGYKLQGCALTVTKANRTRDMARETNGKGGGGQKAQVAQPKEIEESKTTLTLRFERTQAIPLLTCKAALSQRKPQRIRRSPTKEEPRGQQEESKTSLRDGQILVGPKLCMTPEDSMSRRTTNCGIQCLYVCG
eukprot:CAMPEP_0194778614 /NCGR_PEP_ID=MMETSP0323_2-20130528/68673_1 /TAXON_ID=2866 ORGANISM="Crypthecodinium cohnii, Strain Seligo" /NCGR_SAMPLE_ID=MMETSP0323_2 /ASSEMBLY_ACC=CAM_ASM_000346 /LENGTH=210 /DNA_ID=CAMNT_0039715897 /DNA_START=38 /DNA_END=666 /DNA_ORIENTATION=-